MPKKRVDKMPPETMMGSVRSTTGDNMSEDAPKGRVTGRLVDPRQVVCVECACGALTLVKRAQFASSAAMTPRCSEESCGAQLVISDADKRHIESFILETPKSALLRTPIA